MLHIGALLNLVNLPKMIEDSQTPQMNFTEETRILTGKSIFMIM